MSTEQLLQSQAGLAESIFRIKENYPKDSKNNKNLDYLVRKHSNLVYLWDQFIQGHSQISGSLAEDHLYWDKYKATSECYEKIRVTLENGIKEINSKLENTGYTVVPLHQKWLLIMIK